MIVKINGKRYGMNRNMANEKHKVNHRKLIKLVEFYQWHSHKYIRDINRKCELCGKPYEEEYLSGHLKCYEKDIINKKWRNYYGV